MERTRTAPLSDPPEVRSDNPSPGLILVHATRPLCVPLAPGQTVGRDWLAELGIRDDQMSRAHFAVDATDGVLRLRDAGSRNGTFVGGRKTETAVLDPGDVVRAGQALFVVVEDILAFQRSPTHEVGDEILGSRMSELRARAAAMSRVEQLLVLGESGVGKEHIARAFHSAQGERAPFVALNCATLQPSIAERLLFGARRGAYTGVDQDAVGLVQAADGGTLFLDEIAELDLAVQAKLLRFAERREYFPVGDTRARTARTRLCFATMRDLGAEVSAGRFRDDLFHRIGVPSVEVPPLRERQDEIPFLVALALRRGAATVKASLGFVEAALLAPWPGNIRQLLRVVEASAVNAEVEGRDALTAADVPAQPERPVDGATDAAPPPPALDDEAVQRALTDAGGNVSVAARALGVHRSRLRRLLSKKATNG